MKLFIFHFKFRFPFSRIFLKQHEFNIFISNNPQEVKKSNNFRKKPKSEKDANGTFTLFGLHKITSNSCSCHYYKPTRTVVSIKKL